MGRTSFLWAAGFVVLAALTVARGAGPAPADGAASYWRRADIYHGVALAIAFAVFAGAYLALEALRRGRRSKLLGAAQFGLMFVGGLMILSPSLALAWAPIGDHRPATFHAANLVAASGYVLVLAGLALFLVVAADALRREPEVV